MRRVKAEYNQTIWDIAIQYMGSVEAAVDLLVLNPALNASDVILKGLIVVVPDEPIKKSVVDNFEQSRIVPATMAADNLLIYVENDGGMITKNYNYPLTSGDKSFDGIRLYNLDKDLTIQINYSSIDTDDVFVELETSLDGINWTPLLEGTYFLNKAKPSHTFTILGLVTAYVRLKVDTGTASAGVIDKVIYAV